MLPEILRANANDPCPTNMVPSSEQLIALQEKLSEHLHAQGGAMPPRDVQPAALHAALDAVLPLEQRASAEMMAQQWVTRWRAYRKERVVASDPLAELQGLLEADAMMIVRPAVPGAWIVEEVQPIYTDQPLTKIAHEALRVAAMATAIMGVPLQIDARVAQTATIFSTAYRALNFGDDVVLCLPQYAWNVQGAAQLHAVVCVRRPRCLPPPSRVRWLHVLACVQNIPTNVPQALPPQPLLTKEGNDLVIDWAAHVDVLDPDMLSLPPPRLARGASVEETAAPPWTTDEMCDVVAYYRELVQRCGVAMPGADQHPQALLARLRALSSVRLADDVSGTAETSALSLSNSALTRGASNTLRDMVGAAHTQLAGDAIFLTLFALHGSAGQFTIGSALAEQLPLRERCVVQILAAIGALHGAPQYIAADNPAPIFRMAREVLDVADAFIILPVFSWREASTAPAFHGVFVAVRDGNAAPPTPIDMLRWQLFCQAMYAPLQTLADDLKNQGPIRSVDVSTLGRGLGGY